MSKVILWSTFLSQVDGLSKETFLSKYQTPALLLQLPVIDIDSVSDYSETSEFLLEVTPKKCSATRLDLLHKNKNLLEPQIVFLDKPRMSVGRETNHDLIFPINEVSRRHAIIAALSDHQYVVIDSCSRNGTYLNDDLINGGQPYALKDQDVIEFGKGVDVIFRTPSGIWNALETSRKLDTVYK